MNDIELKITNEHILQEIQAMKADIAEVKKMILEFQESISKLGQGLASSPIGSMFKNMFG